MSYPFPILKSDCYYTPPWCYKALRPFITNNFKSFLEPCAGDNRIHDYIRQEFNPQIMRSNEPRNGGKCFIDGVFESVDLIISNPPYSLAEECVRKSFLISHSCCWLLKLQFLSSKGRKKLFNDFNLDTLFVLSQRPSFDGIGTDRYDYAWFVWDNGNIFNKKGIVHL